MSLIENERAKLTDEGVMSALEFYALFGAPLLMFLTGLGAYYIALRGARQDRSPAE
ncbi:MAG: hypothetical protein K0S06_1572 [Microvirga sp.]|jgi:hypothetical protein|nr:hypothetical protein [Microvirga sp.]